MKQLRSIFLLAVLLLASVPGFSQEAEKEEGGGNLKEILFGHVQDSYQWHVTDFGGHPLIIPLPMIFYSQQSGFHVYCSSQFAHEPDENLLREGPDGSQQRFAQIAQIIVICANHSRFSKKK